AHRHALRFDDGSTRFAAKTDDHSLLSQPEWPSDHLDESVIGKGSKNAAATQADYVRSQDQRESHDFCHHFSARYSCHVDPLLARCRRYQPRQGYYLDYYSASADGGEYEGRQNGRFLCRRALERARHRRWHWLYSNHHAADMEGSSGKGARLH